MLLTASFCGWPDYKVFDLVNNGPLCCASKMCVSDKDEPN